MSRLSQKGIEVDGKREYAIEGHGARISIMKGGSGGEIVQVQGGHIIRSTGRKDRHSKVYTSKGPRDRRVRLSANTAIQFYDVQDRLGFDRPSKAVDWLIKKARSSIDKLSDLPPWNPSSAASAGPSAAEPSRSGEEPLLQELPSGYAVAGGSSTFMSSAPQLDDSDAMKLFFPTSNAGASSCFGGYTVPPEMVVARAVHQGEDLGLSLHPFQHSPGGLQSSSNRTLFASPVEALGPACSNYPQRLIGWPGGDSAGTEESRGVAAGHGFLTSYPGGGSTLMMVNPQRGTLQSSFSSSFDESPMVSIPSDNHHHNNPPVAATAAAHQLSFLSGRFGSDSLTPFYYTSRVHGGSSHDQHHHHGMISDGPSSTTSPSSGDQ
ncbi:hypothetical protein SAY87_011690 [Trapa incisa]|uniref:TCP domain-containing protein n=1 Tax=Trapa incisa TaxID=236973 RepID=A0AAN7GIW6_9MYRT|nr:hypothetical protein SAY87_011690 [Trapa incisa]